MSSEEASRRDLRRAREAVGSAELAGRLGITENALDAMLKGERAVLEGHWVAAIALLDALISGGGRDELNPGGGGADLDAMGAISDTQTAGDGAPAQEGPESPNGGVASRLATGEQRDAIEADVRGGITDQPSLPGAGTAIEPDAPRRSAESEARRRQQMQRQKLYQEIQVVLSNVHATVKRVDLSSKGRRELLRLGALLEMMMFDMRGRPPSDTPSGRAALWGTQRAATLSKLRLANDEVMTAEKRLFGRPRDIPISAEVFAHFVAHCGLDLGILTLEILEWAREQYLNPRM